MSVRTFSSTLLGIDALRVEVETEVIIGLKRFAIVGLPDGVVKEAKDRVKCAMENSGFDFPNSEVIVSLAPASLPKVGGGFDLSIAIGILAASGSIPENCLKNHIFVGELALDGRIKQTGSELASAFLLTDKDKESYLYVSSDARSSLNYFSNFKVKYANTLSDLVVILRDEKQDTCEIVPEVSTKVYSLGSNIDSKNFSDVVGQSMAKRALQVAAAGGHNVLLVGPPGGGKTMLAERLPSIFPDFTQEEFLQVNKIYSASSGQRGLSSSFVPHFKRQFRSPHHSISLAGLVGGGTQISPGEITLAHNGILFLDEFPELRRDSLEALREPIEKRKISISRAQSKFTFPANFLLIAAMNPCPCGMRGAEIKQDRTKLKYKTLCKCTDQEVKRYVKKISGPLLDRIDIQLWVPQVSLEDIQDIGNIVDVTADLKKGVTIARDVQNKRFNNREKLNSYMNSKDLGKYCKLNESSKTLLKEAGEKFSLSARGYTRVLKLTRTIADLDLSEEIGDQHLIEALGYRLQIG